MDNKQEVSKRRAATRSVRLLVTGVVVGQMIDIIETVYRGASKGRGLVVSPKGALMLRRCVCSLCVGMGRS